MAMNEVGIRLTLEGQQAVHSGIQNVNTRLGDLDSGARQAASGAETLKTALAGLATVGSVMALVKMADAATTLQTQLRLSANSAAEAKKAYGELFAIAQQGRVSFTELGNTYASIARAGKEIGVSQTRLLDVTKSISQAMTIGGGSAASMQAALMQLGQGLSSGTLRGEELNSVMEQTPRLAKAIADGLGVPIGKLRELGAAGELTSQQVIGALEKAGPALAKEMESATLTVGQAFTMLSNSTVKFVGQADEASGVSATLAGALKGVSGAIDTVGSAINNNQTAFAALTGGLGGAAAIAGLAAVAANIGKVRVAFLALSAVMAANPITLTLLGIGAAVGAASSMIEANAKTLDAMKAELKKLESSTGVGMYGGKSSDEAIKKRVQEIDRLRGAIAELETTSGKYANAEDKRLAAGTEAYQQRKAALEAFEKAGTAYQSKEAKNQATLTKEIATAREAMAAGAITAIEYAKRVNDVRKSFDKAGDSKALSAAAAAAKKELKEAQDQVNAGEKAYADIMAKETGYAANFTETVLAMAAARDKNNWSAEKYNEVISTYLALQPGAIKAAKDQEKAFEEQAKATDKAAVAYGKYLDELAMRNADTDQIGIDYKKATKEMQDYADLETSLMGQSAKDREDALAQYKAQRDLEAEILKIRMAGGDAATIAANIAAVTASATARAGIESQKQYVSEWNKTYDRISDGLTDALMTGGKEGAQKVRDLLVQELFSKPFQMVVQAIINPVAGALASAATSLVGGGAGGTSLFSAASGAKSFFDALNGGITNAITDGFGKFAASSAGQSMGLSTSAGVVGPPTASGASPMMLTEFGQTASGWATTIGGTLAGIALGSMAKSMLSGGYSVSKGMDTFQNIGIAVGSAIGGPILGAVIGAGAGVFNALFGRKFKDSGLQGTFGGATGFTGESYQYYKGGLFRSDKTTTNPLDADMQDGMAAQFKALQVSTAMMADTLGLAADSVSTYTTSIKLSFKDLTEEQIATKIGAEFGRISDELAQSVLGSYKTATEQVQRQVFDPTLSGDENGNASAYRTVTETVTTMSYTASEFAKKGETASQTLSRLSSSLVVVNTAFELLNYALFDISLSGANVASRLMDAFDGLDQTAGNGAETFTGLMAQFVGNFYSSAEQMAMATETTSAAFAKLGIEMPAVNAELDAWYRAEVEHLAAMYAADPTDANAKALAGALGLQGGINSLADGFDNAAQAAASAAQAMSSAMAGLQSQIDQFRLNAGTTTSLALAQAQQGTAFDNLVKQLPGIAENGWNQATTISYLTNPENSGEFKSVLGTEGMNLAAAFLASVNNVTGIITSNNAAATDAPAATAADAAADTYATLVKAGQDGIKSLTDAGKNISIEMLKATGDLDGAAAAQRAMTIATFEGTEAQKAAQTVLLDANTLAQKSLDRQLEENGLKEQLLALTETSTEALTRQRDALDESNRAIFDQIQAQTGLNSAKATLEGQTNTGKSLEVARAEALGDTAGAAALQRAIDMEDLLKESRNASTRLLTENLTAEETAILQTTVATGLLIAAKYDENKAYEAATASMAAFKSSLEDLQAESRNLDIELARARGNNALADSMTLADAIAAATKGVTDQGEIDRLTYEVTNNASKQKELDTLNEKNDLLDELNSLTDTNVEALKRQRDALDESNRTLFDQVQAQTKLNTVKDTLKGYTDTGKSLEVDRATVNGDTALAASLQRGITLADTLAAKEDATNRLKVAGLSDVEKAAQQNIITTANLAIAKYDENEAYKAATASLSAYKSSLKNLTQQSTDLDISALRADGKYAEAAAAEFNSVLKNALKGITDPAQIKEITTLVTTNAAKTIARASAALIKEISSQTSEAIATYGMTGLEKTLYGIQQQYNAYIKQFSEDGELTTAEQNSADSWLSTANTNALKDAGGQAAKILKGVSTELANLGKSDLDIELANITQRGEDTKKSLRELGDTSTASAAAVDALTAAQTKAAITANNAAILSENLNLLGQAAEVSGDWVTAAAIKTQQHAIALQALDPSLRAATQSLWAAQAAAAELGKNNNLTRRLLSATGDEAALLAFDRNLELQGDWTAAQIVMLQKIYAAEDAARANAAAQEAAANRGQTWAEQIGMEYSQLLRDLTKNMSDGGKSAFMRQYVTHWQDNDPAYDTAYTRSIEYLWDMNAALKATTEALDTLAGMKDDIEASKIELMRSTGDIAGARAAQQTLDISKFPATALTPDQLTQLAGLDATKTDLEYKTASGVTDPARQALQDALTIATANVWGNADPAAAQSALDTFDAQQAEYVLSLQQTNSAIAAILESGNQVLIDAYNEQQKYAAISQQASIFDTFATDAQKSALATATLTAAFAAINTAIPATREEFLALAQEADPATESGRLLIDTLSEMSDEFQTLDQSASSVRDAVSSVLDSLSNLREKALASDQAVLDVQDSIHSGYMDAQQRVNDLLLESSRAALAFSDSIEDFLNKLKTDSGQQSLTSLKAQFSATATTAAAGDIDSQDKLLNQAQTVLDSARASSRNAAEYARAEAFVRTTLQGVQKTIEPSTALAKANDITLAQQIKEAQAEQLKWAELASITGTSIQVSTDSAALAARATADNMLALKDAYDKARKEQILDNAKLLTALTALDALGLSEPALIAAETAASIDTPTEVIAKALGVSTDDVDALLKAVNTGKDSKDTTTIEGVLNKFVKNINPILGVVNEQLAAAEKATDTPADTAAKAATTLIFDGFTLSANAKTAFDDFTLKLNTPVSLSAGATSLVTALTAGIITTPAANTFAASLKDIGITDDARTFGAALKPVGITNQALTLGGQVEGGVSFDAAAIDATGQIADGINFYDQDVADEIEALNLGLNFSDTATDMVGALPKLTGFSDEFLGIYAKLPTAIGLKTGTLESLATALGAATNGATAKAYEIVDKVGGWTVKSPDKDGGVNFTDDMSVDTLKAYVDRFAGQTSETAMAVRAWAHDAGIPGYAVGTNYVPADGPAYLHAGETITPRPYVDMQRESRDETNALLARLLASNEKLSAEVAQLRRAADSSATSNAKTANTLVRVTRDGNALVTTV